MAQKVIDKHREMLMSAALSVASRVLVHMDENQELKYVAFTEEVEVPELKIQVKAENDQNAPYMMIQIVPDKYDVETLDMGDYVVELIRAGGVTYTIPREWVETLVRSGESLS